MSPTLGSGVIVPTICLDFLTRRTGRFEDGGVLTGHIGGVDGNQIQNRENLTRCNSLKPLEVGRFGQGDVGPSMLGDGDRCPAPEIEILSGVVVEGGQRNLLLRGAAIAGSAMRLSSAK